MAPNHPWHPIPPSPTNSTCTVHLLQAGHLLIPHDLVLLPDSQSPNEAPNNAPSTDSPPSPRTRYYAPDYCFLVTHARSSETLLFDLGMRADLENLPPTIVKSTLPVFHAFPKSPAEILKKHGTPAQQPDKVHAVIFSHVHFDHVGDGAKAGFGNAEIWVGPTTCTYARPGYPEAEDAPVLSENFPTDGSRKIVEAFVSDARLAADGDSRVGKVAAGQREGKYEAIELRDVGDEGWVGVGAFDRAWDVFGDGAAYLVDAPGHSAGHQMLLVRVAAGVEGEEDNFVVLAGDCYHHPDLLKDPERTARPPYTKGTMHTEPKTAIDTIWRTRAFAVKDNIWVLGAHDFSVGDALGKGKKGEKEVEGLVMVNKWRENGWKSDAHL